jgi:hypothetical protein
MRDTPMRWPSTRDTPMGDGLLEMHVYKDYHSRKRLLEKPAFLTIFLPAVAFDKEDP